MKTDNENFAIFRKKSAVISYEGIYTEKNFVQLLDSKYCIFKNNRDEKGRFCKPYWHDANGNFVAYVGDRVFEFDGNYDKYVMKPLNELEIEDFYIIFREKRYIDDEILNLITITQFAALIDLFADWQISFNDVIKVNGWTDETDQEYGICSDGKYCLQFDSNAKTEIINI